MAPGPDGELRLTEERLARVSVLQELTVAALDLFDPRRAMDDFLDRLATRLGCVSALCLGDAEEAGALRLYGAAGLSRASRSMALPPAGGDPVSLELPFPELAREGVVRWHFRVTPPEPGARPAGCSLLLFFEGGPHLPAQYHGVVERLAEILRTALLHRQLYARTLESERRLWEQKTRLECQTEASLDGILFLAVDGEASYNARFAEAFGLPVTPPAGLPGILAKVRERASGPDDLAARMERHRGCKDDPCRIEVVLADGRRFDTSCAPIKSADGHLYGRAWYFREITERVRAEQERAALLEKEQAARAQAEDAQRRTAFLAEASRLLAGSLDYSATLERVAHLALPAFADWCVVDVVEEDGRPHRVAVAHLDQTKGDLVHALRTRYPPRDGWKAGVPAVLASGRSELIAETSEERLRQIAYDGEHLALLESLGFSSAMIVPLVARGRRLGAISLVYGASGRRYGPGDLALAEDLACRAALAVDNARLYLRMHDAVRARDEFLSIASHELRTPITSVQLAAQGLLRLARNTTVGRAPPEFVVNSLETAVRQSQRLAHLIDKLLDVSRIQAGRLDLQLDEVDLAATVREIVAHSRDEIHQAGSTVRLSADAPVVGRWDKERLEQVVVNLLSNALKYGEKKPIDISVTEKDGLARLVVKDEGIGIPPERQSRVFERFERAVSARHYSGLGLGLYIVRRVLEAHGGTVRLKSAPGEGTEMTVELPVSGPKGGPGGVERRGAA